MHGGEGGGRGQEGVSGVAACVAVVTVSACVDQCGPSVWAWVESPAYGVGCDVICGHISTSTQSRATALTRGAASLRGLRSPEQAAAQARILAPAVPQRAIMSRRTIPRDLRTTAPAPAL